MKEHTWRFCDSSQPLLQRCIEAASRCNNADNLWLKHFGVNTEQTDKDSQDKHNMSVDEVHFSNEKPNVILEVTPRGDNKKVPDIFSQELSELDPINNFDEIMEKCLQNKEVFTFLAKNLPYTVIEKLCDHILALNKLDLNFLKHFYKLFLLEILKRDNTHLCLDVLMKAKTHEKLFDELLFIFINDTEVPKHVLLEYISTLNASIKLQLLKRICQTVSEDVFLYHMHTIHMLYKESENCEDIQRLILQNLKLLAVKCVNDKNFGKFLLNFIQIQKKYSTDCSELDSIVASHASVFKKPCVNALNEIKRLQTSPQ